jgi:hypothetical protein
MVRFSSDSIVADFYFKPRPVFVPLGYSDRLLYRLSEVRARTL